jgi:hypothetical protein
MAIVSTTIGQHSGKRAGTAHRRPDAKQGLMQQLFPSATEEAAAARIGKFRAVGAPFL